MQSRLMYTAENTEILPAKYLDPIQLAVFWEKRYDRKYKAWAAASKTGSEVSAKSSETVRTYSDDSLTPSEGGESEVDEYSDSNPKSYQTSQGDLQDQTVGIRQKREQADRPEAPENLQFRTPEKKPIKTTNKDARQSEKLRVEALDTQFIFEFLKQKAYKRGLTKDRRHVDEVNERYRERHLGQVAAFTYWLT